MPAPRASAGLLVYRGADKGLEVFIGHMGGPFWSRKNQGAWSIPKGEIEPGEIDLLQVARREFAEEIGVAAPDGPALNLGEFVQRSGKRVHCFAVAAREPITFVASNMFSLEWPPHSGRFGRFPEIDRADWFPLADARRLVVAGQVAVLDALAAAV